MLSADLTMSSSRASSLINSIMRSRVSRLLCLAVGRLGLEHIYCRLLPEMLPTERALDLRALVRNLNSRAFR